jgi:N-methylhydantoinase A
MAESPYAGWIYDPSRERKRIMRFATDTGGTFTDLVVEDDAGAIRLYKASTTPSDPVQGVLEALALAADDYGDDLSTFLGRGELFIHGTTHAINAIITGRTARTALLVTRGHGDIMVFREGGRVEPFNHTVPFPRAFVPRALTFEVEERIVSDGKVLTPLDEASVRTLIVELRKAQVEAVAICLLWATINPQHELRLKEMLAAELPDVPVSLSHEVNPTLREFRRASSTAIDASLKPIMSRYMGGLNQRLRDAGFKGEVMVLTSSGGMMAGEEVARHPVRVINSGPSMAPIAGRRYAALEQPGRSVIVADTGGTTYDISLVRDGRVPMTRELWIGERMRGHLVGYPSVDVKSVGAGGGSIARVDAGGLLHVGPTSAGSTPGPVCYGRGGEEPTVTDAAVTLGYVDPDFFLGGAMHLDAQAAKRAVEERVAKPLRLPVELAAWHILQLATQNMVKAIMDITVAQGIDPAKSILIGGGGAAGLNSVFIARRLGCDTLVIPETGAALSAAGALMSDLVSEHSASVFLSTANFDFAKAKTAIASLTAACGRFASTAGARALDTEVQLLAEARYENQVWDIDVPVPETRLETPADVRSFRSAFDAAHEQIFTIRDEGSAVEIVGLRAMVRCRLRASADVRLARAAANDDRPALRPAYFAQEGWAATRVHFLDALEEDVRQQGPAIIESDFTSVVVDPGATFRRTASGNLVIHP